MGRKRKIKRIMAQLAQETMTNGYHFPERLVVENRPELSVFPLSVKFTAFRTDENGNDIMGSAIYEPDFSSHVLRSGEDGNTTQTMMYWNKYNRETKRNDFVAIIYRSKSDVYRGVKIIGGKEVANVEDNGWYSFFQALTARGLFAGEACRFEKIKQNQS